MLRQQLGRGPAAVLRGAQIEAPRPRRALRRHDLAALVALALLFALLVPSAQVRLAPAQRPEQTHRARRRQQQGSKADDAFCRR